MRFKCRVLQAKWLSSGVAPGGFRSSLRFHSAEIYRRDFNISRPWKGRECDRCRSARPRKDETPLGMQQVREMSPSSSSSSSRYPFVSLELGQWWPPGRLLSFRPPVSSSLVPQCILVSEVFSVALDYQLDDRDNWLASPARSVKHLKSTRSGGALQSIEAEDRR